MRNWPLNLDEIVRFNKAVASASAINFRPDIWVLPFLNVYEIFSRASTSTGFGFGIGYEAPWRQVDAVLKAAIERNCLICI